MSAPHPLRLRDVHGNALTPAGILATNAGNASPQAVHAVEALAGHAGLPFVHRRNRSIEQLFCDEAFDRLLVWPVAGQPQLHRRGGAGPLFYHPGMGLVRIKRLADGHEDDRLLIASGVRPGDRVLDCTAGLGSDAVVWSHAVGAQGICTALEARADIAQLFAIARATHETGVAAFDTALRRVDARCAAFREAFAVLPDDSYDIVYFDPMFDASVEGSHAMRLMRDFADLTDVTRSDLGHALRIARRAVVIKGRRDSALWRELGVAQVGRNSGQVAYGLVPRR